MSGEKANLGYEEMMQLAEKVLGEQNSPEEQAEDALIKQLAAELAGSTTPEENAEDLMRFFDGVLDDAWSVYDSDPEMNRMVLWGATVDYGWHMLVRGLLAGEMPSDVALFCADQLSNLLKVLERVLYYLGYERGLAQNNPGKGETDATE